MKIKEILKFSRAPSVSPSTLFQEFMRTLELVADPKLLIDAVVTHLERISRAETIHLYLRSQDGDDYPLTRWIGEPPPARWRQFLAGDRLVSWSVVNEEALVFGERPETMDRFPPEERDYLYGSGLELSLPFIALNRLVGLALLGRSTPFIADEIIHLSSLSAQVALALENAWLGEQQRLRQSRLYRAERLAAVGELAAGAAHEIRNPLTSISSMVEVMGGSIPPDDESSSLTAKVMAEVDRINRILDGLLSYARPARLKTEKLDLNEILSETVELTSALAHKARTGISLDLPEKESTLNGDPDQLKQAFLNVMLNGLQAMPDGGALRVALKPMSDPKHALRIRYRIEINDEGTGISQEVIDRVFDPFFTTKAGGTGLGLSIVYGIVHGHDGEVEVFSQEGKGTTVRIEL
ncbi:ATP-binding protein [candidate division KSB1 bacterium]